MLMLMILKISKKCTKSLIYLLYFFLMDLVPLLTAMEVLKLTHNLTPLRNGLLKLLLEYF